MMRRCNEERVKIAHLWVKIGGEVMRGRKVVSEVREWKAEPQEMEVKGVSYANALTFHFLCLNGRLPAYRYLLLHI